MEHLMVDPRPTEKAKPRYVMMESFCGDIYNTQNELRDALYQLMDKTNAKLMDLGVQREMAAHLVHGTAMTFICEVHNKMLERAGGDKHG